MKKRPFYIQSISPIICVVLLFTMIGPAAQASELIDRRSPTLEQTIAGVDTFVYGLVTSEVAYCKYTDKAGFTLLQSKPQGNIGDQTYYYYEITVKADTESALDEGKKIKIFASTFLEDDNGPLEKGMMILVPVVQSTLSEEFYDYSAIGMYVVSPEGIVTAAFDEVKYAQTQYTGMKIDELMNCFHFAACRSLLFPPIEGAFWGMTEEEAGEGLNLEAYEVVYESEWEYHCKKEIQVYEKTAVVTLAFSRVASQGLSYVSLEFEKDLNEADIEEIEQGLGIENNSAQNSRRIRSEETVSALSDEIQDRLKYARIDLVNELRGNDGTAFGTDALEQWKALEQSSLVTVTIADNWLYFDAEKLTSAMLCLNQPDFDSYCEAIRQIWTSSSPSGESS